METNLTMLRFRPNLVIHTDAAFAEDEWPALEIGAARFRMPKPCARCIIVNIDPETSEKNPAVLAELAQFRQQGRKILFGVNACLETGPVALRVGDPVRVVSVDASV
jgi:hypothetical protein